MTCGIALKLLGGRRGDAELIDETGPKCACERCSVSEYGRVEPAEDLLRIIVSPFNLNAKRNAVRAGALSIAEDRGMSTFRAKYATDEELLYASEQIVTAARTKDQGAGIFGVLIINAMTLKAINDNADFSAYCIYDTALPYKPAHADVFQRVIGFEEDILQTRRQNLFAKVKNTFVSVDEFRNGLLMRWRPPIQVAY